MFSAEAALEAGAAGAPVLPALEAAELLPLPQAAMENTIEAASSIGNPPEQLATASPEELLR